VPALAQHARDALFLALTMSLPIVVAAAVVGIFVAMFQAASQIQDPTVAHLPRLIAVVGALLALGPWLARLLGTFAERMFLAAGTIH
jgi:flagellar biosynthetic protein FliQ